jgi:hypothetical protein
MIDQERRGDHTIAIDRFITIKIATIAIDLRPKWRARDDREALGLITP